ncbi:hypothetical protein [Sinorhizobium sp. RAC02]|uniref:hypothetical protein n=1 Tax=Sinorhizobium sp. RAC02 TaxID=1842534 RepID=UPI00083E41C4|nr:hypothetical protein [Sinorhizobium sp. RAC02]
MNDLDLSPDFYINWSAGDDFRSGQIYHFKRNKTGGSLSTPVARFFITSARIAAEGFFPHHRLDCFISNTELVLKPEQLARDLFEALKSSGLVGEPTWLGWHVAEERGGAPYGEVFDFD